MIRRRSWPSARHPAKPLAFPEESLRQAITERYSSIGPKQRAIAKYLLEHQEFGAYASVHDVAKAAGVHASTVVRFARSIGMSGYPALRQELRQDYLRHIRPPERLTSAAAGATRPELAVIRQEANNLHQLMERLGPGQVEAAGRLLLDARRILVIGTSTHAIPGIVLAHLGEAIGLPISIETTAGPRLASRLASLSMKDLLVAAGFWRVAREIVDAARWAKDHQIATLILTDSAFSPLAPYGRVVLTAPTESVSFIQSMTAPLAVAYAILAWVMTQDAESTKRHLARVLEISDSYLEHWKTSPPNSRMGE